MLVPLIEETDGFNLYLVYHRRREVHTRRESISAGTVVAASPDLIYFASMARTFRRRYYSLIIYQQSSSRYVISF